MTNEKIYMGFLIPKVWQILKHFAVHFHWAQTLKLWGVVQKFAIHLHEFKIKPWHHNTHMKHGAYMHYKICPKNVSRIKLWKSYIVPKICSGIFFILIILSKFFGYITSLIYKTFQNVSYFAENYLSFFAELFLSFLNQIF